MSECRGAFAEAQVQHTPHGGREAEADLDGPALGCINVGDPEPQRLSDGPVGLEHTQPTVYEREKGDLIPQPHCSFLPCPNKIKGLWRRFGLYRFLHARDLVISIALQPDGTQIGLFEREISSVFSCHCERNACLL